VEYLQTLSDTSRKIKRWIGKRRFVRWVFAKVWAHRLIGWQGKSDKVVIVLGWKSALIDKGGGGRQGISFVVKIGPWEID
jgi:hypothetical protein